MSTPAVGPPPTTATSTGATMPKSEPQRIYWQQWIASSGASSTTSAQLTSKGSTRTGASNSNITNSSCSSPEADSTLSRRELITSSAAVRISAAAKASDLTALLRQTLHLPPLGMQDQAQQQPHQQQQDSLVLVGTLYSLPRDYVQFEHELVSRSNSSSTNNDGSAPASEALHDTSGFAATTSISTSSTDPFHVVQTVPPHDSPLQARQKMEQYLQRFLERAQKQQQQQQQLQSATSGVLSSNSSSGSVVMARTIISPKLQWYYVPAPSVNTGPAAGDSNSTKSNNSSNSNANAYANNHTIILNCVELDGYCTDMDDEEADDDQISWQDDENFVDDHDDDDTESLHNARSLQSRPSLEHDTSNGNNKDGVDDPILDTDPSLLSSEQADAQWLSSLFSWYAPSQAEKSAASQRWQQRLAKEDHLFEELERQQTSKNTPTITLSGFLLKRDAKDINVWRRVYCILTHDYLWYVSRIYTKSIGTSETNQHPATNTPSSSSSTTSATTKVSLVRCARHGRIQLTRALLLEPVDSVANAVVPPLVRTPYAWEMVSGRGITHVFRANSRAQQQQWIRALQEGTVQSFEQSLVTSAELLIRDSCLARNQRRERVAVEPLWEQITMATEEEDNGNNTSLDAENIGSPARISASKITSGTHVQAVLRFGLQVADYRECCRYIQSVLPNASSIRMMMMSSNQTEAPPLPAPSRFASSLLLRSAFGSSSASVTTIMDTTTHDMIHAAWDRAAALLVRATHVGLMVQRHNSIYPKTDSEASLEQHGSVEVIALLGPHAVEDVPKLSHSVNTLCRHIDYVITGRFRREQPSTAAGVAITGANRVRTVSNDADHEFQPPPEDLFDRLLSELQIEAVVADRKQREVRWHTL